MQRAQWSPSQIHLHRLPGLHVRFPGPQAREVRWNSFYHWWYTIQHWLVQRKQIPRWRSSWFRLSLGWHLACRTRWLQKLEFDVSICICCRIVCDRAGGGWIEEDKAYQSTQPSMRWLRTQTFQESMSNGGLLCALWLGRRESESHKSSLDKL